VPSKRIPWNPPNRSNPYWTWAPSSSISLLLCNQIPIHVPGPGVNGSSEYRVFHRWSDLSEALRLDIVLYEGDGEEYEAVHLFQIEANSVNSDLDYSDYQEVKDHYQPEEIYHVN
jgi:hypothetical protein